ncbi:MAG TPA: TIGR02710 family CRISPR-associated CARF protein [Planctomycetota bacterium]|nr:TIGR02710 family CRISPR-associated CARF protein [Planctomycetota bacterium]
MTAKSKPPVLYIATVGSSPEPILHALTERTPDRVVFIVSPGSRRVVEEKILPALGKGVSWELLLLPDPEDLTDAVRHLRALTPKVTDWVSNRAGVLADYTGGTKVMSAALLLAARRWPAEFLYVGGDRRTKDGLGVVETGSERLYARPNPLDAFGYQAVEDAAALFNGGYVAAAGRLLRDSLKTTASQVVKRLLGAVAALAEGYAHWDAFRPADAVPRWEEYLREAAFVGEVLHNAAEVRRKVEEHLDHVCRLAASRERPSSDFVRDLAANAKRRFEVGRVDEAVAVCYRAIEATAQIRLEEKYGLKTSEVPLEALPESMRAGRTGASVKLALQDAYQFLAAQGDELGRRFQELGLHDPKKSVLVARNQSILAHGFQPVGEETYLKLSESLRRLAGLEEGDLERLRFPRLEA